MNDTINTLMKRRSVRAYLDKQVEEEKLKVICEAGSYAATASGKMSPSIICITNKDDLSELEKLNAAVMGKEGAHPFYGAKAAILVVADADNKNCVYDGSLVMGNLMNAAASLGLGSCWIHRAKETFEKPEGKAFLDKWGVKGNIQGIGYLVVGYTNDPVLGDGPARKPDYIRYIK